jgi:hypothetical protein
MLAPGIGFISRKLLLSAFAPIVLNLRLRIQFFPTCPDNQTSTQEEKPLAEKASLRKVILSFFFPFRMVGFKPSLVFLFKDFSECYNFPYSITKCYNFSWHLNCTARFHKLSFSQLFCDFVTIFANFQTSKNKEDLSLVPAYMQRIQYFRICMCKTLPLLVTSSLIGSFWLKTIEHHYN